MNIGEFGAYWTNKQSYQYDRIGLRFLVWQDGTFGTDRIGKELELRVICVRDPG